MGVDMIREGYKVGGLHLCLIPVLNHRDNSILHSLRLYPDISLCEVFTAGVLPVRQAFQP